MIRLLSLLSLFLGPLVTSAKDLNLEIPLLPHPVKISLPENFDPSKKHPTFFYYHGSGGRPTTELMRRQTGPDDWIIVGMTYTDGGRATLSQEPLTEEIKAFQRVRQQLLRQHASDPDRLYVGGFSLGGWHSDLMLQSVPSLRGGIILGAGHARRPPGALSKYADQKSVHIGVGREHSPPPRKRNSAPSCKRRNHCRSSRSGIAYAKFRECRTSRSPHQAGKRHSRKP